MNLPAIRAKCLGRELDANLPAVWQGRALNFQCGFFRDETTPEDDFDNVSKFCLVLSRERAENSVIASAAVIGVDWMSADGWENGTEQHVTFQLSGSQMEFPIRDSQEQLWWAACAVLDTGEVITKGTGFLLVREDAAAGGLGEIINSASLEFSIIDDVAYLTVNEETYSMPVVLVGQSGVGDDTVTTVAEILYFHYLGREWAAPGVRLGTMPLGALHGRGVVLGEILYVTIAGVSYTHPVVAVVETDSIAGVLDFTIVDDVCLFLLDGLRFRLPVALVASGGTIMPSGINVLDDVLNFYQDGQQWATTVVEAVPAPSGLVDGTSAVINDALYVTLFDGVTYAVSVTQY